MRAEDLIFWLDRMQEDHASSRGGVLCQRHADTMVVPRNWTLDDLRDPDLHLFRPPAAAEGSRRRNRRARSADLDAAEQLALGVEGEPHAGSPEHAEVEPGPIEVPAEVPADMPVEAAEKSSESSDPDDGSGEVDGESWTPSFDENDDLGGLLSARSPLLARAFRGDDRPRA